MHRSTLGYTQGGAPPAFLVAKTVGENKVIQGPVASDNGIIRTNMGFVKCLKARDLHVRETEGIVHAAS